MLAARYNLIVHINFIFLVFNKWINVKLVNKDRCCHRILLQYCTSQSQRDILLLCKVGESFLSYCKKCYEDQLKFFCKGCKFILTRLIPINFAKRDTQITIFYVNFDEHFLLTLKTILAFEINIFCYLADLFLWNFVFIQPTSQQFHFFFPIDIMETRTNLKVKI